MQRMIAVTDHRREKQVAHNEAHGVVPQAIQKDITESLKREAEEAEEMVVRETGESADVNQVIREIEQEMVEAAEKLEYERAALLRDELYELKAMQNPQPAAKREKVSYVGRKMRKRQS